MLNKLFPVVFQYFSKLHEKLKRYKLLNNKIVINNINNNNNNKCQSSLNFLMIRLYLCVFCYPLVNSTRESNNQTAGSVFDFKIKMRMNQVAVLDLFPNDC